MKKQKLGNDILEKLKKLSRENTRWFVYTNHDLSSTRLGEQKFLAVGPKNTIKNPPNRLPDSHAGIGWAYVLEGAVNTETGEVE